MSSRTVLSGGYRLVRRYMLNTYWVLTALRVEGRGMRDGNRERIRALLGLSLSPSGAIHLEPLPDLDEPQPRIPAARPVVGVRDEEREVVARGERGLERGFDHCRAQAVAAEAGQRGDLVDLADALSLEERAEGRHLVPRERGEHAA